MPGLVFFLRCVGRATVKNSGKALASLVPFGEFAFEIARDACEEYRKQHGEEELRHELEALVRAPQADLHLAAEEAARAETGGQPAELRLALVSYLDQLPAAVPLALPAPADVEVEDSVTIEGPTRPYVLLNLLGAGDAADVHLARNGKEPVGPAGPRYLVKRSRTPEGNVLLDGERRALGGLFSRVGDTTYRRYLPALVESFSLTGDGGKRVNVFAHEPGLYTLEQIHDRHPTLDGRHLAWIFKRMLTVLGFAHARGIVHGAVLPSHVLLHTDNHGLRLVGWGQSVETGRSIRTLAPCYRDWYPREVQKKLAAAPATDLFLAARCLIYLAGGDPLHDRMPDGVPPPMRQFVRGCLLESVRMRPDDAWKLQDEFDEMLRKVYGPPRFHDLHMN